MLFSNLCCNDVQDTMLVCTEVGGRVVCVTGV